MWDEWSSSSFYIEYQLIQFCVGIHDKNFLHCKLYCISLRPLEQVLLPIQIKSVSKDMLFGVGELLISIENGVDKLMIFMKDGLMNWTCEKNPNLNRPIW